MKSIRGYYFITDEHLSRAGSRHDVAQAVAADVTIVQYRRKDGTTREMIEEAAALKALCGSAAFVVNDRLDVALAVGADGVHLGQDDMPYALARRLLGKDAIIGITAHDLAEAKEAQALGADYVGLSPIFATTTKLDAGKPSGIVLIEEVKKALSIPLVAIGGINHDNALSVIRAGADSLCAISCVVTKPDVAAEIRKFQQLFTGNTSKENKQAL